MTDTELPRPDEDTIGGWETELALALGYTFAEQPGLRMPDGSAPTAWNLIRHPFAFLEDTREVIAWEVDGEPDASGVRRARLDPANPNEIAMRPVRYPLPADFEFVTVAPSTPTYRVALRKEAR